MEFSVNPIPIQTVVILQNTLTFLLFGVFKLVLWCLSSQQQFGALTVKSPLTHLTRNMANLKNSVTHLLITIHSFSYGAFYVSDIYELIWCNSHLIFKIQFVSEILSYVSNSSFSSSLIILIITTHFRAFGMNYSYKPARRPICKILSDALDSFF